MLGTGPLFFLVLGTFSVFAWFVSMEEKRGARFLLTGFRDGLDKAVGFLTEYLSKKLTYLGRHIIKMSWYYSIHKTLRFILTAIIKFYDVLEGMFMRNRDRARTLKVEKRTLEQDRGHLGLVADHKASSALSEPQKKKLLQKKLERG